MKPCDCVDLHSPRRVVLTGGPGAGKTAVLELIRLFFCVHVTTLPEAAGIEPGDRVALLSRTRYEWTLVDFALLAAGAVVVPLYDGASVVGELGFNRRLSVSNNNALDPSVTRDAFGMRVSFEPNYFQVIPDVDLTVPIGLGYAFSGRSSLGPNVFGPNNGGDFSIALNADYHKQVKFGLQYTHYLGTKGPLTLDPVVRQYSYYQTYADRDFISFSVQTSF